METVLILGNEATVDKFRKGGATFGLELDLVVGSESAITQSETDTRKTVAIPYSIAGGALFDVSLKGALDWPFFLGLVGTRGGAGGGGDFCSCLDDCPMLKHGRRSFVVRCKRTLLGSLRESREVEAHVGSQINKPGRVLSWNLLSGLPGYSLSDDRTGLTPLRPFCPNPHPQPWTPPLPLQGRDYQGHFSFIQIVRFTP